MGTKIDPTLSRADRLVGQVLGEKGKLPVSFFWFFEARVIVHSWLWCVRVCVMCVRMCVSMCVCVRARTRARARVWIRARGCVRRARSV